MSSSRDLNVLGRALRDDFRDLISGSTGGWLPEVEAVAGDLGPIAALAGDTDDVLNVVAETMGLAAWYAAGFVWSGPAFPPAAEPSRLSPGREPRAGKPGGTPPAEQDRRSTLRERRRAADVAEWSTEGRPVPVSPATDHVVRGLKDLAQRLASLSGVPEEPSDAVPSHGSREPADADEPGVVSAERPLRGYPRDLPSPGRDDWRWREQPAQLAAPVAERPAEGRATAPRSSARRPRPARTGASPAVPVPKEVPARDNTSDLSDLSDPSEAAAYRVTAPWPALSGDPVATVPEPDPEAGIDDLMDALGRALEREYRRFYGDGG